jgi:DNA modification methylase
MKVNNQTITEQYSLYQGDCCEVIKGLPEASVHYTIFSPPFSSLYSYSASERDMGNCQTDKQFFGHFDYLIPELLRVTLPGRLCSVHSMIMPRMKERDGFIGIYDFPGDIVRRFFEHGWIHHSRVVVWKDPLIEATRTKSIRLAHKQIVKDSVRCGHGTSDYLDTFLKPGDNSGPVSHAKHAGFDEFIGDAIELTDEEQRLLRVRSDDPRKNKHSHVIWRRYASPVWNDIRQTRVVGQEAGTVGYQTGRESDDTKHICPLQLDVIERCLELWTNENDIVLSPFMGVGSEGYSACKMGRRFVGIELKESYFRVAEKNVRAGAEKWGSQWLFNPATGKQEQDEQIGATIKTIKAVDFFG